MPKFPRNSQKKASSPPGSLNVVSTQAEAYTASGCRTSPDSGAPHRMEINSERTNVSMTFDTFNYPSSSCQDSVLNNPHEENSGGPTFVPFNLDLVSDLKGRRGKSEVDLIFTRTPN